jgi:hypothetical protein
MEHERLEAALNEVRARVTELEAERNVERRQYESTLRAERTRALTLLDEREQWQGKLTEVLRMLTKTSAASELLNVPQVAAPMERPDSEVAPDSEPAGDPGWGF